MNRNYRKRRVLRVCEWCMQGMEYHCGKQAAVRIYVDSNDEKESFCMFCKESGFDRLFEIIA